ncbi:MAG: SMI1/KNR4 family protein [Azoarcus sp.]|jgi:hypothetical protein|nr:SMI1/KNR4 family protein [Azoarcus sp.]
MNWIPDQVRNKEVMGVSPGVGLHRPAILRSGARAGLKTWQQSPLLGFRFAATQLTGQMTMNLADKERLLSKFNGNPPMNVSFIRKLESDSGLCLPDNYVRFLQQTDGGEGFIGNAYLILWRVGDLIEMNKAYQVADYAPGLFLFGSDGGDEAFAFDMRTESKFIVSVPFVGMELELIQPLGATFNAFLETLFEFRMMPHPNDIRKNHVQDCANKEIFEIQPVILGGSPTDPRNKAVLTRKQHIEAVRYWNNVILQIKNSK